MARTKETMAAEQAAAAASATTPSTPPAPRTSTKRRSRPEPRQAKKPRRDSTPDEKSDTNATPPPSSSLGSSNQSTRVVSPATTSSPSHEPSSSSRAPTASPRSFTAKEKGKGRARRSPSSTPQVIIGPDAEPLSKELKIELDLTYQPGKLQRARYKKELEATIDARGILIKCVKSQTTRYTLKLKMSKEALEEKEGEVEREEDELRVLEKRAAELDAEKTLLFGPCMTLVRECEALKEKVKDREAVILRAEDWKKKADYLEAYNTRCGLKLDKFRT